MKKVDNWIPDGSIFRMIIQGGKNPEGPVGSKLFAVMDHIRKGKEDYGRNGQEQEQKVPVSHYSFIHY